MTDEIINAMVEEINGWIKLLAFDYAENGRTNWYSRTVDRINGMCTMLRIATGHIVTWDEKGVVICKEYKVG